MNVVRLLPGEQLSNSSKQFGSVRGYLCCGQGKNVIKVYDGRFAVRPNMCQVKDLNRKLTVADKERAPLFCLLANCEADGGG